MRHLFLIVLLVFTIFHAAAQEPDNDEEEVDNIQIKVDSILSLITPSSPDSIKRHQYYVIGVIADNSDTAIKYANLSLELCQPTDYSYIADNYYNIGVGHYMQDKSREALTYFFKSSEVFEKINHKKKIADNAIAIGKCYHDLNLHDSSLAHLGRALDLYTELKDTADITYTYQSIGNVNFDLSFHETAKDYYMKALKMDSMANNFLDMAYDYKVLGNMILETGTEKDALMCLLKSTYIFDTIPTDDQYYINAKYETYIYIAEAYITYAEKNSDTAYANCCLDYIKKIGDYFITTNYTSNQFSTLQCYARYLSFIGKNKEALDVMLECQKYLDDDQRDIIISIYYKRLMDIYRKIGDYKNALEASDKMHQYKESSINDSTMNVVAKFQADQEVKIHKAETAAKQKQMRIIIFSLIGGLVLVTLLVINIMIALKIKRKANEDLMHKNHILDQQKSEIEAQRDEIWS
ncbi:MAG: tetratricopeptide repeat protein, partial [Bacteroidales bacterium]|nr:tetratricopeptide repeat protein [Bacteroidales bacterium]